MTSSRRNFLKQLSGGAGITALSVSGVLEVLIRGRLSQASAATVSDTLRKYVFFQFYGAPIAFPFHLPLNARVGESVDENLCIKNQFSGGQMRWDTQVFNINGQSIQMPSLWGKTIPTVSGAQVPISSLLENHIFVRGIDSGINSHTACSTLMQIPDPTKRSVGGIVADRALTEQIPLPAVLGNYSSTRFKAQASSGLSVDLGASNLLESNILSPFLQNATMESALARRSIFSAEFNRAIQSLKAKGLASNEAFERLQITYDSFESLIRKDFGNLSQEWNNLKNKYQDLISQSSAIEEILTEAIPTDGVPTSYRQRNDNGNYFIHNDLRDLIRRTGSVRSSIISMAESFALSEFMLRENLGASMLYQVGGYHRLFLQSDNDPAGSTLAMGFDTHYVGVLPMIVASSFLYRSFAACLYEFRSQLNAFNQFENTVIHYGGEFPRSPRGEGIYVSDPGGGSDHGYDAHAFGLMSGAIKKPSVVGNIYRTHPSSYFRDRGQAGTWGLAAPISNFEVGSTTPNMGHAASTICMALGVPSPTPNFSSLITETSDGLVPAVEFGKIVDS